MQNIEMFFDHTCPYCYRGHQYLTALLPKYPQVNILWRPVEAHPKAEEPWHKPYADLAVQGALFIRAHGGDELAYHERLYKAQFDERTPVDNVATLTACAAETGADADAFQDALQKGLYQQEQLEANTYAYERHKVWAVPTFVCGEKRLDAVEGVGITPEQLDVFLKDCCG